MRAILQCFYRIVVFDLLTVHVVGDGDRAICIRNRTVSCDLRRINPELDLCMELDVGRLLGGIL